MSIKYVFNPTTGNLDATDKVAFNGEVNAGSAASPSVFFTGDPNTGIYSPGADQLALSTSGAGRVFIDASGNVGVQRETPAAALDVETFTDQAVLRIRNNSGGANTKLLFANQAAGLGEIWYQGDFRFVDDENADTERLRITSAGLVGIGTSTVNNEFVVRKDSASAATTINIWNGNSTGAGGAKLRFGHNTGDTQIAYIDNRYFNDGSGNKWWMTLAAQNGFKFLRDVTGTPTEVLTIDSSGRVGIGTTPDRAALDIVGGNAGDLNNPAVFIQNSKFLTLRQTSGNWGMGLYVDGSNNSYTVGLNNLIFGTGSSATERFRCDSSGRLLVGTASAGSSLKKTIELHSAGTSLDQPAYQTYAYPGTSADNAGYFEFYRSRGSTIGGNTIVAANDTLGYLRWYGANGTGYNTAAQISAQVDGTPAASNDMPGRLVFSTTADGASSPTEQLRITSDRYVRLASGTGGIQFNGDTAAANALDDYEEGTWTPVIVGQTTAGTGTYSTQVGRYTKVGRQVHCIGTLIWTAHDGTGNMRIEGLPFSALSVSELFNAAVFAYVANITMPADSVLMGDMQNNTSRINLRSVVTGGGAPAGLTMDSAGNIYFSITYQTN